MKRFDELLDGVLREDAAVQPRGGFEARVMARVKENAGQSIGQRRWLRRGWILVPVAACLGVILLIQHSSFELGNDHPANISVAHRNSVVQPEIAVVKQSREMEMEAVSVPKAVMPGGAHRIMKRNTEIGTFPMPKLEMFPVPAAVDMFPRPVKASERESQLAALRSEKVAEAWVKLQQEQNEPIRIAAIEIAPIQLDADTGRDQ
jgi:hypothetical protein